MELFSQINLTLFARLKLYRRKIGVREEKEGGRGALDRVRKHTKLTRARGNTCVIKKMDPSALCVSRDS